MIRFGHLIDLFSNIKEGDGDARSKDVLSRVSYRGRSLSPKRTKFVICDAHRQA